MFAAILLTACAAPVPPAVVADWKPVIKAREFKFDEKNTGADYSVTGAKKAGIVAEFQPNPERFGNGTFVFQKKDCPKVTVNGHEGTPAVVRGDVLYIADFSPRFTGCKMVAYDLTTGKRAWEKELDRIVFVGHSAYRNRVAMAVEKHPDKDHFALVIVGWESSGRYVEVLDLVTGKQLAHKNYDSEK